MVVCRYYAQGSCRFGKNCRFEHVNQNNQGSFQQQGVIRPSQFSGGASPWGGGGGGGASGGAGGAFGSNNRLAGRLGNQPSDTQSQSVNEIFATITQEMSTWEQSHMWPFSCFGYARSIPSLPGLEDLSMDEVRLKAYEANNSGTAASYQQWVASTISEYQMKRKQLQNPDQATRSHLITFINNANKQTPQMDSTAPSLFSTGSGASSQVSNQTPSVFGGSSSQTSAFGSPSVFGGTSGAAPTQSLFGNSNQAPKSAALSSFNPSTTSVFGNAAASQGPAPVFGTSSVFGNAQASSSSIFGSSQMGTSGINNAAPTAVDNQMQTAQGGQNVFGAGAATSAGQTGFVPVPTGQSVFGNQTGVGLLGNAPAQSAAFTGQALFGASTQSVFGNAQAQTASPVGLVTQQQPTSQPNAPVNMSQTMSSAFPNTGQPVQATQSAFGNVGQPVQTSQSTFGNVGQPVQTSQSGASNIPQQTMAQVSSSTSQSSIAAASGGGNALSTFSFAANKPPAAVSAPTPQLGLFGKPVSQTGSAFSSSTIQPDQNSYTPLDQLTALEREQFEAAQFTPGLVPIRPPPLELC